MISYPQLILQFEDWIRSGQLKACAQTLQKLNTAKVPDEFRQALAVFARRVGKPHLGLRILTPLIRSAWHLPTASERAEYGVLLQRCGAHREAEGILEKIPVQEVPDVLLYRSFCLFARWDYDKAVPLLQKYLESGISPYSQIVGRVNLADALIFTGELKSASELLHQISAVTEAEGFKRLHGNCQEMLGQIQILRGDYASADSYLGQAKQIFESLQTLDQLYVSRWRSVSEAFQKQDETPLLNFRIEASLRGDAESIRQADRFRLQLHFREELYESLYFGTPSPAYRKQLERQFGRAPNANEFVRGSREGQILDIQNAKLQGEETAFQGLRTHALLAYLSQDFYRPSRPAEIFGEVWPGEHFDIFRSPHRVHKAVARAREWLVANQLDIQIESRRGAYQLVLGANVGIRVQREPTPVLSYERHLYQLRQKFLDHDFKSAEACLVLGLSNSAFRRFCQWALHKGHLEKFGSSTQTVYSFPADNTARHSGLPA